MQWKKWRFWCFKSFPWHCGKVWWFLPASASGYNGNSYASNHLYDIVEMNDLHLLDSQQHIFSHHKIKNIVHEQNKKKEVQSLTFSPCDALLRWHKTTDPPRRQSWNQSIDTIVWFFCFVCNWLFTQWLATENWLKSYNINNICFLWYHLLSITNGQAVSFYYTYLLSLAILKYLCIWFLYKNKTDASVDSSRIPVHKNGTTWAGFQKFWKRTAFCLFVNVKTPSPSAAPRED